MEFVEITENLKAYPGEYVYHVPSREIVLCGAFNRDQNFIRALSSGKMLTDSIENFRKISISKEERKASSISTCKGCGK